MEHTPDDDDPRLDIVIELTGVEGLPDDEVQSVLSELAFHTARYAHEHWSLDVKATYCNRRVVGAGEYVPSPSEATEVDDV